MKRLLFFQQRPEDRLWLRALSAMGEDYRTDVTSQEKEAVCLLEQQSYSLLILSLRAPTEETARILEHFRPEALPQPPRVVLLSSATGPELPRRFPGAFCTVLQLPMTLRRLLDRLSALAELPPLPSVQKLRQKWNACCARYGLDGESPRMLCLRDAVLGRHLHPTLPLQTLYAEIAQEYRMTATQAERSVGYGLRQFWKPPLPPQRPAVREALSILYRIVLEEGTVDYGEPDGRCSSGAARHLCR